MLKGRKKNILFIGHEASLSGAPVLLLNLLLLLQEETDVKISLVIRREGSFINSYKKYFPVIILKGPDYGKEKHNIEKIKNLLRNRLQVFRLFILAAFADKIFSNTIINGKLLKTLSLFKKKTITYVHELQQVIDLYMHSGDAAFSLKYSALFAYPSLKVKEVLARVYKIEDQRLLRLSYYFPVDPAFINNGPAKTSFRNIFRQKFNLADRFIVGSAGVLCERKGTDLFIEVCSRVVQQNKNIQFCWIGLFENVQTEMKLKGLIEERKLAGNILLTGPLPHHDYNFFVFDLFFLSSREDPYPLVVPEAGLMKVPSVCFENSGGITEFIGTDAGWIIPGFSVDLAAEKILHLYNNRDEIARKGNVAFNKTMERHSNKKIILGQFNELINHN